MAQSISKSNFTDLVHKELNTFNAGAESGNRINFEEWLSMNGKFYREEYGYYYSETHEGYVYDLDHELILENI